MENLENEPINNIDKEKLKQRKKKRLLHKIWLEIADTGKTILISFAIFVIVFNIFLINANVPSGSMEPTLQTNSRLIANRLAYKLGGDVKQGDIIIFPAPDSPDKLYVKRVIALGGDTIKIEKGKVYIKKKDEENYVGLTENYVINKSYCPDTPYQNIECDFGPYEVPEDSVFVMGDNRPNSNDARYWTNKAVPKKDIKGKAVLTYWPFNKFGIIK